MPHDVPPTAGARRKVVVVGGGVGGMEAARVARLRGHEVVLLEATDRLGGQVNLAAKAPGPRGDRRHRRLARGRARDPGRGRALQHLCRGRRRAGAGARTWSSSPPAACRTRASSKRAKSWSPASGTCSAAMPSRRQRAALRRPWLASGPVDRGGAGQEGRLGRDGHPRPHDRRSRSGPPTSRTICASSTGTRSSSPRTWSCARSAATATGSSPRSGTSMPRPSSSGSSTMSWSSTARCRRTSSTSRSRMARRNGGEIDVEGLALGAPMEIASQPGGPLSSLPDRRRRSARATCMPRSTMRCGSARASDLP